jgi:hypothetical protein
MRDIPQILIAFKSHIDIYIQLAHVLELKAPTDILGYTDRA